MQTWTTRTVPSNERPVNAPTQMGPQPERICIEWRTLGEHLRVTTRSAEITTSSWGNEHSDCYNARLFIVSMESKSEITDKPFAYLVHTLRR